MADLREVQAAAPQEVEHSVDQVLDAGEKLLQSSRDLLEQIHNQLPDS